MPKNYSDFCYKFLEENKSKFDNLEQYNVNYDLDRTKIKEFIDSQTCCKKYFSLLQKIFDETIYISCEQFTTILDNNINALIDLHKEGNELILILTEEKFNKSNIFFTFYTLHKLQQNGIRIEHIYSRFEDCISYNKSKRYMDINPELTVKKLTDKKYIFVFCDDVVYSGEQMSHHLIYNSSSKHLSREFNKNIKIFLNIVGILSPGLKKIRKMFDDPNNILILTIFTLNLKSNLNDLLYRESALDKTKTSLYNSINDCYIIHLDKYGKKFHLENLLQEDDVSLVYLFYKYPDEVSTYRHLCYINNISDKPIFNLEKFCEEYELDITQAYKRIISHNGLDVMLMLIDHFSKEKGESITEKIIRYIKDRKPEDRVSWIEISEKIDNVNLFENKYGKWFTPVKI